jgi:hypothetical protein
MARRVMSRIYGMLAIAFIIGCSTSSNKVTSQPATVSISVSPSTASVQAGQTQQFTASVTGTSNTAVTWSVAGGEANGTISAAGLYTAPATVPASPEVTVQATAQADTTKTATATVTVTAPAVSVSVSPSAASVQVSATQQFTATVSNTKDTAVTWSVSGSGCTGASCGIIDGNGLYTAPAAVPSPATATVKATSHSDTSKSASATVTITAPAVTISLSPKTASVEVNKTQTFKATVGNSSDTAVNWSIAGAGCTGAACGSISSSGLYTAPAKAPSPNTVTLTATAHADATKTATASITITAPSAAVTVSVGPKTVSLAPGGTQKFTATITDPDNAGVTWSVAGTSCTGAGCGTIDETGLYTAPATPPAAPAVHNAARPMDSSTDPTVTVTATAVSDPTITDSATVTLIPAPAAPGLNGSYALEFPQPYLKVLAHFSADGHGNITGGVADDHTGAALHHFTGTYTVRADGRGTMNLTIADSITPSMPTVIKFVLDGDGNGWIMNFSDTTAGRGTHGGGSLRKQQAGAFAMPSGNFVFTASEGSDTSRSVLARIVVKNGQGNGNWEIEDGRTDPAAWIPETISASFSDPDHLLSSTGRVQLKLHSPILGDIACVVYMYSATEGFIETIDGGSLMNGVIKAQANVQFSNASWKGTAIFRMTGYSADWGGILYSMGAITSDGKGSVTATVDYASGMDSHYQYIGKAQCQGDNLLSIDADGHGSLLMACSGAGGAGAAATFYMLDQNTALAIGGTPDYPSSQTPVGTVEPQEGGPYSLSAWQGIYAMGYNIMADYNDSYPIGILSFDGAGAVTGMGDENDTKGRQLVDLMFPGTYTMEATGRGTFGINSYYFENGQTGPIWIVSPKKAYLGKYILTKQ